MTDVKIYTITSDDLSPPIIGEGFCTDMVRHSDYAALEARLNQLAAEVAEQREQAEEVYAAGYNHGHLNTVDGIAYAPGCKDEFYSLALQLMFEVETPNTDAWQREQMAKGVEAFAANKREWADHWEKHGVRDGSASRCVMVAHEASEFANKLRNGEAV